MAKKKILFLTTNIGGGHTIAAKGIQEALELEYPGGFEFHTFDAIELLGPRLFKAFSSIYKGTITYAKFVFKAFFEITDKTKTATFLNRGGYRIIKEALAPLEEIKPDLIVSCFPILDHAVRRFLDEKGIETKIISVLTDTGDVHSAWISNDVDYYVVPTEETAFFVNQKGVAREKILLYGFPLRQAFYQKPKNKELRKELGIPDKNKVILMLGGAWSTGVKAIDKISAIDENLEAVTILVATGENKRLLSIIKKESYKNQVIPFPYTADIAKYYHLADLILTKAGGASIMEAISVKKPMIITEVLPGQEEPNARFIETMGFGYIEENDKELTKRIDYIFGHDLGRIKENLSKYPLNQNSSLATAKFIHGILVKTEKTKA